MAPLPSGTVTFLFTDIEGSTQLLQTLGEQYALLLADQQALLSEIFARHDGRIIDTQGDSFFVAFPRAVDGVNAAVDAQRALVAHAWTNGVQVRVRMGLHTGEPTLTAERYVGMDVHRAARIGAAGHGGQVLLSETTYPLIKNDFPSGVTVRDLGEHRLKDLRQPKHLYQLIIADLPAEFPPPRTLDTIPNNLPVQLTSFVGREKQIAEIQEIITRSRVVTLTGAGGSGKTRLSLEVAAELVDAKHFKNGIWFVELAPLSDSALVTWSIATVLGIQEQSERPILNTLLDFLQNKSLLLILDNCEHLLGACAELSETILRACPNVKVLASSREPLGIAGEISYRVPSLSLPSTRDLLPHALTRYEAVRLFIERAAAVQASFAMTNENAPTLTQICYRLDGIPLALELAAARVRVLSVEQISKKLDDRFRLLTGGARGALPRQQTLRATIDWSYDLLSEPERALLRRMSVFAGGCMLQAVEVVCTGEPIQEFEILDWLTKLVDKSLVQMEDQQGEARYHLLETVRQYAREKLLEAGEADRFRDAHLNYFVRFAEAAAPLLFGPEQLFWLERMETEHDNLRAAMEWAIDMHAAESAMRLAVASLDFWDVRVYQIEWRERLLAVLAQPEAAPRTTLRAAALVAGVGLLAMENVQRAALAEESLSIGRELQDTRTIAQALFMQGRFEVSRYDRVRAQPLLEQSLALWRTLDDKRGMAETLSLLANWYIRLGADAAARPFIEQSLALGQKLGSQLWIARSQNQLSGAAMAAGDYGEAFALLEESIRIAREFKAGNV